MAVYFIHCQTTNLVKIGFSEKPRTRFAKMQVDSGAPLKLLAQVEGDVALERQLHERFSPFHRRGEWFRMEGSLAQYIADLPPAEPIVRKAKTAAFWNGMSSESVARALGLPKSTVSSYYNGARRPSPEIAIRLQRLTGVSAIKLVFGDLAEEAA